MPTNITAVDTFTDPVVAPADGDGVTGSAPETMGQGLANRTLNNKNRIDATQTFALYAVSGAAAGGAKHTLTEHYNESGFTLASDEVEVPAAGDYEVTVTGDLENDNATADLGYGIYSSMGGSGSVPNAGIANGTRFSTDVLDAISVSAVAVFRVVTPATDVISVRATAGLGNVTPQSAVVYIRRIS